MSGYSRSLVALAMRQFWPAVDATPTHADYALEHSVDDMLKLLAHLGRERPIWVG